MQTDIKVDFLKCENSNCNDYFGANGFMADTVNNFSKINKETKELMIINYTDCDSNNLIDMINAYKDKDGLIIVARPFATYLYSSSGDTAYTNIAKYGFKLINIGPKTPFMILQNKLGAKFSEYAKCEVG